MLTKLSTTHYPMWVRKSSDEIARAIKEQKQERFSPLWPFLGSTISTPIFILYAECSFLWVPPIFFLLFLISYTSQIIFKKGMIFLGESCVPFLEYPKPDLICVDCKTFQKHAKFCLECGGKLELTTYWKWMNDGESSA